MLVYLLHVHSRGISTSMFIIVTEVVSASTRF